jgi:hypothetical protein
MKRKLLMVAVLGLVLSSPISVPADDGFYVIPTRATPGTCITSLPYTISAPGYYYLTRNLTSIGGNGITVNADHVTLDLMGFVLGGPPAGFTDGINITTNNVEVRNGTVRGWFHGVYSSGSGSRAIGVRAVENTSGIILGSDALIKGCTASPGISTQGQGLIVTSGTISGCTVMDFSPSESSTPQIYLGSGGRASDNLVLNCGSTGIKSASGNAVVTGNVVSNCKNGIDLSGGSSLVANTIVANSGQTALIFNNTKMVMDQNSIYLGTGATLYSGALYGYWGLIAWSHEGLMLP